MVREVYNNFLMMHGMFITDLEWKNNLHFVRIFFDTPTFDRITKDRAAKFVDMLSAIGGWGHHGTSHRVLNHQWSGDSLLCS